MPDLKGLDWRGEPSRGEVPRLRKPGLHIADQISPGGAREEPWAAGFVTSNGTHIPLFVPLAQGTPDYRVPRSERKNR